MIVVHETLSTIDVLNLIQKHINEDKGYKKHNQWLYDEIMYKLVLEKVDEK